MPTRDLLRALAKRVGDVVNALWWFLAPLFVVSFLVRGLSNAAIWLNEHASPVLALIFILVCGLIWLVLILALEPEHFAGQRRGIHRPLATGFISAVALAWVWIFALLSYTLSKLGLVTYVFSGAPGTELPDLCDSYAWYLLDLIPVLDVNEALGWSADVVLEDGWRGLILLAFRVLIAYQLFALARQLFSWSRKETKVDRSFRAAFRRRAGKTSLYS